MSERRVLTRRAPKGAASSWNETDRTFRAVIAAGAPVARHDRFGEYLEALDHSGVTLGARIPLLNSHRTGDASDVVGVVEKVEQIGGRLEAVLRLSSRPQLESLAGDIRDGVISGVSIGYSVESWQETEDGDGHRIKTAIKWRLLEVSVVALPADEGARIRSSSMSDIDIEDEEDAAPVTRAPERLDRREAKRVKTIRELGQIANAPDLAVEHIDLGTPLPEFRKIIIQHMADEQQRLYPTTGMHLIGDAMCTPAHRGSQTDAMAEALAARIDNSIEPSAHARQFVGLSLPEMAREHLRSHNVDTRLMGRSKIIAEALNTRGVGGLHSTSDFGNILSSAVGRVLRKTYESAASGLKPVARRITIDDFRARNFVGMSGFAALEKVNEHGEFKRGSIEDSGESVRLESFGKIFGVTRQALINDDLSAFAEMPRKLGVAASQFEADQLAALLAANPLMCDGKAVFHADHRNVATVASALSKDALSAARKSMRTQRDDAGQLIGVAPRWLVVGPELETLAEELMATINPSGTDEVQPIRLRIAVEPRLAGFGWYVAADPSEVDGLVCAHLASEPGPQLEYRNGFDVDGVEMKVRLDFGCAFIDFRSWYRNAGASPGG